MPVHRERRDSTFFPNPIESLSDLRDIQRNLHNGEMFSIECRINLCRYLRFHNMVDGQIQGNTRKRACPCWVSMRDRFRIEFRTIGIRSPDDNDEVVFSVFLNNSFDTLLAFQVKCARRGSDKTLRLNQQRLRPGTLDTCRYGLTLYSIPFAQNNDLLTL